MKKVFTAGLLAIALIAVSQQQASAWVNARLGFGVNLGWQSGNNCFFWGAWHNGEHPGPASSHHGHHHDHAPPVYLPFIFIGHHPHHSHASYPTPGPIDSFAMSPYQYANYPTYPQAYYYYYPTSYYYGR